MFKILTKDIEMKRLFISIAILITLFVSTSKAEYFKDVIITSPTGIWTDERAYNTLSEAVSAIGSAEQTLLISREVACDSLTIPANIKLHFVKDGSINNSGTLILETKDITAGDHQIFTGSGPISFAKGSELRSTWFSDFPTAAIATADEAVTLIISRDETVYTSCAIGDDVILKWDSPNTLSTASGITISNIGSIEAGKYQIFTGAGDFDFRQGSVLKSSWFSSILAIDTFTDDDNVDLTIEIDRSETVSVSMIFDQYQGLKVNKGCTITINDGVTLTQEGPFEAGLYHVFNCVGTGKVNFISIGEVYVEWWGAIANGTVNCISAINNAIDSLPIEGGAVIFSAVDSAYRIESPIYLNENYRLELRGIGRGGVTIKQYTDNTPIISFTGSCHNVWIHGFTLTWANQQPYANTNAIAIDFNHGTTFANSIYQCTFSDLILKSGQRGIGYHDLTIKGSFWGNVIERVNIVDFSGNSIFLRNCNFGGGPNNFIRNIYISHPNVKNNGIVAGISYLTGDVTIHGEWSIGMYNIDVEQFDGVAIQFAGCWSANLENVHLEHFTLTNEESLIDVRASNVRINNVTAGNEGNNDCLIDAAGGYASVIKVSGSYTGHDSVIIENVREGMNIIAGDLYLLYTTDMLANISMWNNILTNSIMANNYTYIRNYDNISCTFRNTINEATPSVKNITYFQIDSTVDTTITNFEDGIPGQIITLCNLSTKAIVIKHRAGGIGQISNYTLTDLTLSYGRTYTYRLGPSNTWYQLGSNEFQANTAGPNTGADGTISSRSTNPLGECNGFLILRKDDGTAAYVPYWNNISP